MSYYDKVKGRFLDLPIENRWGYNTVVTSDRVTAWPTSSYGNYIRPATATTVVVSSSSGNDTLAGTGARTVRITGVGSTYTVQSEIIEMAGNTPVTSALEYIDVFKLEVVTAGSGGVNSSFIVCSISGVGCLQWMDQGACNSTSPVRVIPSGMEGYIVNWGAKPLLDDSGETAVIKLQYYDGPTNTLRKTLDTIVLPADASAGLIEREITKVIPEKSSVVIVGSISGGTQGVYAGYDIILRQKSR